ncbi:MAG: hypothetical protein ACRER3_01415 [Pseudomonas fluorescens]
MALEWWESAREQEREEEAAYRRSREMGIDGQSLHPSGYTFDELVDWYGGSYRKALEYWQQTSRYDHHTPAGRFTSIGPPPEEMIDIYQLRADINREERIDRLLLWGEERMAWEVWCDGMSEER